ncbi:S1/P1 nuclease [Fimicolochytrium jonesii]|uniref:S1/P1 nuclease n=1 Tax=Fimicolochytrium jonesii TaxID=1396493 RepID=UPI0022FE2ECD|nr:S1/P1 nuclease [Fimicolochytrium jonesii]KAI8816769.1 S1/P1 nuclease [Fimicolochytrium jonesii]
MHWMHASVRLGGILCGLAVVVAPVEGYGRIGHWLTGQIAQKLLTSEAEAWVRFLLPDYDGSLARASLWADEIHLPWASKYHYVNPPTGDSCTANFPAPSPSSPCTCILSAIQNYTRITHVGPTLEDRSEAIKFLIHYIGDVHQPLHVSSRGRGGTTETVRFNGRSGMSFHEVWDYGLLELREKRLNHSRTSYADYLLSTYPSMPATCDPFLESQYFACPALWATESAALVCKLVYPALPHHERSDFVHLDAAERAADKNGEILREDDLAGAYFDAVIVQAEERVVHAGRRMAQVLNAIAASASVPGAAVEEAGVGEFVSRITQGRVSPGRLIKQQ